MYINIFILKKKKKNDVLRRLPSSIGLVDSDAIYHGQCESNFFTKKTYTYNKRDRNWTQPLDATQIMQWSRILKNYANSLMDKQNCYSKWASCKNVFICRKRYKCLRFKMDEKVVRTTLRGLNFFHRSTRPFEQSLF